MKWELKTLDQLGTVSRGRSKHRPRNDPSLFGGIYPFIQTADVKSANFYIAYKKVLLFERYMRVFLQNLNQCFG